MDRIEEALRDKKAEIEKIEAPAEMEQLLKQALQGRRRKTRSRAAVAVLIALLIFTYNFDVLAYYGKKFAGYDHITIGALSKLNEEGRGQQIGKSCLFSNGAEVTIDGIMFDDNELVVFYKIYCTGGKLEEVLGTNLPQLHINGIKPFGYHSTGGTGIFIDDRSMSFIDTMEPPRFYEKWLEIDIRMRIGNKVETKSVRFTLDRSKAMERTARMDLRAEAILGDYRILFDEFSASAMGTQVSGRIIPKTDAALEAFMPETAEKSMEIPHLGFDIISDIGKVRQFSGGQSASDARITFTARYDALHEGFKTLQIRNIRLESMMMEDKAIDVSIGVKDIPVLEDLILNSVYIDGEELCISISSRGIPVIGLFSGGEQLSQVDLDGFELEAESQEPVERVYRFRPEADADLNGVAAEGLELRIKGIRYVRFSTDTIDIPVD